MPLYFGSNKAGSLYLGSTKIGAAYLGSVKVYGPSQPVLPANTIRCKFTSGYTPTFGDSQTLVDSTDNIWDIYKSGPDWSALFDSNTQLEEVIAANTTGVTRMSTMFYLCTHLASVPLFDTSSVVTMSTMFANCTNLVSVPLFDTSSVVSMSGMFSGCTSLVSVPLFVTSRVTDMNDMFNRCYAVESGALALYNQASSQANPPTSHRGTFKDCGRDTVTGAAELAQIPASWGGTGS